jgi:D-inositol-3-phosphate glycosyltransferase
MTLFDSHDLLVVPPGLDCDGLPGALSQGLPCVVARASGMSDAITPGVTGAVIGNVNAAELAVAIASVLVDDDIYRNCLERAPAMAAYFSWERVARQVAHVISREVGLVT